MKNIFASGAAALLLAAGTGPALRADDLTLLSLNCYCFPAGQVNNAKTFGKVDLHAGVDTPPDARIATEVLTETEPNTPPSVVLHG